MHKLSWPIVLSAAALAVAFPVQAQWYAGATAGASELSPARSQGESLLDLGFDDASTSIDDKDSAYRIHGGYRFHRNFAVELGYVNLGRYNIRSAVLPAGTLDNRLKVEGVDLSAVGLLPLSERFTLYGRVGVFAARTRAAYSSSGSVQLIDAASNQSERTHNVAYGLGAMYSLSPRFGVVAEVHEYRKLGKEVTGGEFDARTVSAGLVYRF